MPYWFGCSEHDDPFTLPDGCWRCELRETLWASLALDDQLVAISHHEDEAEAIMRSKLAGSYNDHPEVPLHIVQLPLRADESAATSKHTRGTRQGAYTLGCVPTNIVEAIINPKIDITKKFTDTERMLIIYWRSKVESGQVDISK